ncbi:MAG: ABC transporter permease [Gammaproteobacteria bacterium]
MLFIITRRFFRLTSRCHFLPLLSLLAFLGLWQSLAVYLHNATLPEPWRVALVLWRDMRSGVLFHHLGITLLRLAVSFSLAMLFGCVIGIVLGRHDKLNAFFDNWLVILLNIPALVTIILCYVWFGLSEFAAILAVVVNKVPNVAVTLREGARALDKDLLEMAHCYRFSRRKTLLHVIWPQLHPFVMSATRSGLALVWKIILVVELLGRSDGMGYQLHLFFQLFDVASILAYSIAFVAVIQLLEFAVLKPLDKKALRWRR